ncbi:AraC family transcriptional regulator [Nocardiopsis sp. MG754419]|uniref:AraC family transcriptional regulator n=1 Tax=Nocardiopsis sp. MG754419 TaxID=2259865 RepID=UPI001BA532B4|nr:AraC family transcriptional regulator [Nocardiopsis sp. MG754419]MBR8743284.1 AraC family transcriptional regulator [Nocardiopsis sp. MG754419]
MLDRLNEALERVETEVGAPVDVAAMARTVCVSEHHFRRMFSALSGMPLSEYVRRRRLTLAAAEVIGGGDTLLDVAVRYGYGSAEAFGRAFRSVHGIGPGEARRTGAALGSQSRLTFHLTIEGNTTMRYRIVEKDAFRITGPKARVPLVYEGVNEPMTAFVQGLDDATHERIHALSDQEPHGTLGVTHTLGSGRDEGDDIDYYQAAATFSEEVPDGMESLWVPAGAWVVFPFERFVFPEAIQRIWVYAFSEWFPSNPAYQHRSGPDMLRVDVDEQDENLASGELWMPVEKSSA